jgi:glutamate-1-semialdehyde 2,1-aminomutase
MTANGLDGDRLAGLMEGEQQRFVEGHPGSRALFTQARRSLLGGVPMNWMTRWSGSFPVFVAAGNGAHFTDVDANEYVDLCLGDTGAMTGHSPAAAVDAVAEAARRGITFMLPTEDSLIVGAEMARRFGVPLWQFTLSATDANRFAIRLARHITRRPRMLVFNGCYHGSADETVVGLDGGAVIPRRGSVGPPVDPAVTTRVVEFNDLEALEAALGHGDVACVLAEPVMTNIGIIFPDPGYHDALRELTRKAGTLLIIDETHTICTGPGGYTAAHGLEPDVLTIGKPIGSGFPCGAYGVTEEVGERISATVSRRDADVGGVGGTLAGNALSLAAIKATLTEVLTEEAYERMIPLAERLEAGVQEVIDRHGTPWHVKRLGCRVEYRFQPDPPRNGSEAADSEDPLLDEYVHLYFLNRGILLTPFHNMTLMSPATTEDDVDRHTEVFASCVEGLLA